MASFVSRYAQAFADVVFESHLNAKEALRQLEDFGSAWNESRELRAYLIDPSVALDRKIALLDKLNAKLKMSQQARNLIAVLIRNNRLSSFAEIAAAFRAEVHRRLGIFQAAVTSARTLDTQEKNDLEKQIAKLTGGQVEAQYAEDASLIGGVIVQVGSTVYDGSVRGRLGRLHDELAAG
jgi:F-type H+-transporting ATPase subunit delta